MGQSDTQDVPLKRRRITRACDRCHRGGLKCGSGPTPDVCQACASFGIACTYNRPVKRRGPPARSRIAGQTSTSQFGPQGAPARWEYREVAPHQTIEDLVEIFHIVVYPIMLFFHWPSFSGDVNKKRYVQDQSFSALTMAVCAIASARLRDGAYLPPSSPTLDPASAPSSEVFYRACLNAIPELGRNEFNFMRTEALLGMLCLQYNDLHGAQAHRHRYLAMCAETNFQDESRWPNELNEIDRQERRRLFWQAYHYDVYISVTFGSVGRLREMECSVLYPAEVLDDRDIEESGIVWRQPGGEASFIQGWNFATDLYRVLGHVNERMRMRHTDDDRPRGPVSELFSTSMAQSSSPRTQDIMAAINKLYDALPIELKQARPMTGDLVQDRHGFQAINIIISMQTLKMVLTGYEEHSVSQRCAIAGELLDALSTVPSTYIQSCSTAMLHHLAGVGHLLGSVIHAPLNQWAYLQVRSALLGMADVVSRLEATLSSPAHISSKLREHVQRIDQYMADASKKNGEPRLPGEGGPATGQLTQPLEMATDKNKSAQNDWQEASRSNGPLPQAAQQSAFPAFATPAFAGPESAMPLPQDDLSQLQLPPDLFQDWSFNPGEAFEFLDPGRAFDTFPWLGDDARPE